MTETIKILMPLLPLFLIIAAASAMAKFIANAKTAKKASAYIKRKNIVTDRELKFYRELKQIADKMRLTVLTKVNLADLVEPKAKKGTSEYASARNKIKEKHIDFLICDSAKLTPLLVIELDDKSHESARQRKRDAKKDEALSSAGIPIKRVYNSANLENTIIQTIAPASPVRRS